jgi:ribosomal protein RSM22 (predicted rRNA methylase)
MRLPDALQAAISAETEKIEPRKLASAAARLTDSYKRGEFSTALHNEADRAAYLAVRFPATYAVNRKVFRYVRERMPDGRFESLLDIGAGAGAVMWAAAAEFAFDSVTCLERNNAFADVGRHLTSATNDPMLRSVRWLVGDAGQLRDLPPHDVVTFSYAIGELPQAQFENTLRAAWLKTRSLLVLIEPGTPEGFRRIHSARAVLLEGGAHIVVPCPHHETCPMFATGDWCHFAARLERTAEHRRLKAGSLGYEDENFSYVVGSKHPVAKPDSRVLRHPAVHPGHMRLTLCRPERPESMTVTKSHKALWRYARKLEWGDAWEPPPEAS